MGKSYFSIKHSRVKSENKICYIFLTVACAGDLDIQNRDARSSTSYYYDRIRNIIPGIKLPKSKLESIHNLRKKPKHTGNRITRYIGM